MQWLWINSSQAYALIVLWYANCDCQVVEGKGKVKKAMEAKDPIGTWLMASHQVDKDGIMIVTPKLLASHQDGKSMHDF